MSIEREGGVVVLFVIFIFKNEMYVRVYYLI